MSPTDGGSYETVALVTGASSGIGSATARRLAAAGHKVALVGRRADRLSELRDSISSEAGVALALPTDITDENAAAACVDEVVNVWGRLDIVVNNAGIMLLGEASSRERPDWQRMVDLNVAGVLNVTHRALPHLLTASQGTRGVADLVNVSSVAGRTQFAGQAVYAMTKAGVDAFSESLRKELAPHSIRVHTIVPGATNTELGRENTTVPEDARRRMRGVTRLHADDIADAIHYVVSVPPNVCIGELTIRPTHQT